MVRRLSLMLISLLTTLGMTAHVYATEAVPNGTPTHWHFKLPVEDTTCSIDIGKAGSGLDNPPTSWGTYTVATINSAISSNKTSSNEIMNFNECSYPVSRLNITFTSNFVCPNNIDFCVKNQATGKILTNANIELKDGANTILHPGISYHPTMVTSYQLDVYEVNVSLQQKSAGFVWPTGHYEAEILVKVNYK